MADTAISGFTAASALAGTEVFAGVQSATDVKITPVQLGTYFATNTLAGGTLGASAPMTLAQTWNAGGVTFRGLDVVITETASASGSTPFRVLAGASGTTVLLAIINTGIAALGGVAATNAGLADSTTTNGWGLKLPSAANTNGQFARWEQVTELVTIAASATTDSTIQIPANAIAYAASVRVTVVIPTATTFDIGVAGATTRYGTGISTAATTTNQGTNDGTRFYGSATAIRFTPNATPSANTGRVRLTIHYLAVTPPTS